MIFFSTNLLCDNSKFLAGESAGPLETKKHLSLENEKSTKEYEM